MVLTALLSWITSAPWATDSPSTFIQHLRLFHPTLTMGGMSRGPGRVQIAILEALHEDYDEYGRPELWLCITTLDLGLNEHRESRRRAAHQLACAGLIELCRAPSEIHATSRRFHSSRMSRSLLFARLPYGRSHRTHTLELRAEYEEWLGVLLDPKAEQRDRVDAERWIEWYELQEHRLRDLGDDVELVTTASMPSSAVLLLARESED